MSSKLEFSYKYIPTLAVGGDFFDITKISQNMVGVFIADVMGHGAQPALITVLIKTLLSELFCEVQTPAELLSELNQRYSGLVHHTGIFTSAFYLTIDIDKHSIIFSNAGHPPPLLISQEKLEFKELTKESGLALGLYSEYNYQNYESQLGKGDTVLLYTDGLSDISNKNGEVFGLENLKSVVNDILKKKDSSKLQNIELIQEILNSVNKFTGNAPNPDDMTVLCLERKG
jgi:sigma-B regulation protein RsbU (phosphoserine phosphatase)